MSKSKIKQFVSVIKDSLSGEQKMDFTKIKIENAVLLLAIPMVLEMILESVFALVDLYFVGHLEHSSFAIQTVGLTESVVTVIYSICIGLSMAATAMVSRRIGEKKPEEAAKSGAQAIIIAIVLNAVISIFGVVFAKDILMMMGASEESATFGETFAQIIFGGSLSIVLLFLINGIFRGAGNAAIAMKSLWIANFCNIALCPILINGFGPIPAMGLVGAAIATTVGRSIGVVYQLFHLFNGKGLLRMAWNYFKADWEYIKSILKIAAPGVLQYVISSGSWIFLAKLVAETGGDYGSAGYQTSWRIVMFFVLPAYGLSNAAATLVGQNLGANSVERAKQSVYITAKFNVIYMAVITVLCFFGAPLFVDIFTDDPKIIEIAIEALQILSLGSVMLGIEMVMNNAFNGAGDTWTPTKVNFFGFWILQIPMAYVMGVTMEMGLLGVFIATPLSETIMTILSIYLYRKGKWQNAKV